MRLTENPMRVGLGIAAAAVSILALYLVLTRGSAVLVGAVLLLATAIGTGLILDRVDNSRRPPEDRPPDWKGHPEDYWGFRGRPGS